MLSLKSLFFSRSEVRTKTRLNDENLYVKLKITPINEDVGKMRFQKSVSKTLLEDLKIVKNASPENHR